MEDLMDLVEIINNNLDFVLDIIEHLQEINKELDKTKDNKEGCL